MQHKTVKRGTCGQDHPQSIGQEDVILNTLVIEYSSYLVEQCKGFLPMSDFEGIKMAPFQIAYPRLACRIISLNEKSLLLQTSNNVYGLNQG